MKPRTIEESVIEIAQPVILLTSILTILSNGCHSISIIMRIRGGIAAAIVGILVIACIDMVIDG